MERFVTHVANRTLERKRRQSDRFAGEGDFVQRTVMGLQERVMDEYSTQPGGPSTGDAVVALGYTRAQNAAWESSRLNALTYGFDAEGYDTNGRDPDGFSLAKKTSASATPRCTVLTLGVTTPRGREHGDIKACFPEGRSAQLATPAVRRVRRSNGFPTPWRQRSSGSWHFRIRCVRPL